MPIFEFICKTPQGKEVRGECKAKNADDLERTIRGTGLLLKWWQEKKEDYNTVATREFVKEVAEIIKDLKEPRRDRYARTLKEQLNTVLMVIILIGSGIALYHYLDSRIKMLEELNFQPRIIKQLNTHKAEELPLAD